MDRHQIWIVDPSKLFREGLKMLLGNSPFEVTFEVPRMALPQELLEQPDRPALILIAVQTPLAPDSDEEASLTHICRRSARTPVVVVSDAMSITQLKSALKAGASGYLLRDITPAALMQSLLLVMLGEKVLPTELVSILVEGSELRIP